MIVDIPGWVCHGHADGISAIDIHPTGRRLVTCGTLPQIKMWNLLPILDSAAERDPNVPKLLAVLSEHQGSVLVVRFSNSGQLLASGGNDNTVLVYKLSSAPATAKLGSKWVNLENWKTVGSIRGHALDVTGLSWSPSDTHLATCSMDGSILIHAVSPEGQGSLVHSIRQQHHGWVKAVAFDPVGRYLASQGRNGVKVWDLSREWALAGHIEEPFHKAPEAAFRLRISWTPDGELLLAVNSTSKGQPTTTMIRRQNWEGTMSHLVGHKSSVVAAAANPRLFYAVKSIIAERVRQSQLVVQGAEGADGAPDTMTADKPSQLQQSGQYKAAQANGTTNTAPAAAAAEVECQSEASAVLACSSNDKSLAVWSAEAPLPLTHLSQVHIGPIVDLAWTPDGYTLIAASSDDSISVMRFSVAELGTALTEAEFRQVMEAEYGRATLGGGAGSSNAALLAQVEDAEMAQLAHEAAAAAGTAAGSGITATAPASAFVPRPAAAPMAAIAATSSAKHNMGPPSAAAGAGGGSGSDLLERRLMPTGAGITSGTLPNSQQTAPASRKRVQPTPTSEVAAINKRAALAANAGHGSSLQQQQQQQPCPQHVGSRVAPAATGAARFAWVLGPPAILNKLEVQLSLSSPSNNLPGRPQGPVPIVMVAENGSSSIGSRRQGVAVADVSVHAGGALGECIWRDKVQGEVVSIAGSSCFSIAATSTGWLHTWRSGGNLLLPPLVLGSPPVHMEAQGAWQLLLVGADGACTLLDFNKGARKLGPPPPANIAPLLAAAPPGATLRDAWVSGGSSSSSSIAVPAAAGCHHQQHFAVPKALTAVLNDGSGWMFHAGLGLWMNLQPGIQDLMGQTPKSLSIALSGDAERLRAGAAAAREGLLVPPLGFGGQSAGFSDDAIWARKEAEHQLARALMLGDASGFERYLGLLVNHLAISRDEGRLKELAQDLLGPERWTPAMSDIPWPPTVLGMDKRTLLRRHLLQAAARERLPLAMTIKRALDSATQYVQQYEQQQRNQQQQQQQAYVPEGLLRLGPRNVTPPGQDDPGPAAAAAAAAAVTGRDGTAASGAVVAGTSDFAAVTSNCHAGAVAQAAAIAGDQQQHQHYHQQQQPAQAAPGMQQQHDGQAQDAAGDIDMQDAAQGGGAAGSGGSTNRCMTEQRQQQQQHRHQSGPQPRRLQVMPVTAQEQQQQQFGKAADADAGSNGTTATLTRTPLQEHQVQQ